MSEAYGNLGESVLAKENSRKAFALREKLTDLERFYVERDYDATVSGDLQKAIRGYELAIKTYPRIAGFHLDYAANLIALGQYGASLRELMVARQLGRANALVNSSIVYVYLCLNQAERAEAEVRDASRNDMESYMNWVSYMLAFYRRDSSEMSRLSAAAMGKPGDEDVFFALEADTAAYSGQIKSAREFSRRAVDSAKQSGERETAATYLGLAAL